MEKLDTTRLHVGLSRIKVMDERKVKILRRMTPAERVMRGFKLAERRRGILRRQLLRDHPDWDSQQIDAELARIWLAQSDD